MNKVIISHLTKKLFLGTFLILLGVNVQAQKNNGEILGNIMPSPVELSALIKDVGASYDKSILNSSDKAEGYSSKYARALNLGVYSTDLGYAAIYKENTDAFMYLNSVRKIAESLGIGKYIDYANITKLALENDLNALLDETTRTFEEINKHFQKNGQDELSVAMLAGGWIESLYLTCEIAKKKQSKVLDVRIAEQQLVLSQLLPILRKYKSSDMKALTYDLTSLQKLYKNLKIDYKEGEVTTKEVNGELIVQESTTSSIKINPNDLKKILDMTGKIRAKIVK
ncbi:hypothetical protein [Microscilla marina]|uniref:Uncharacterized protein n=1 Tax=Microscilla marina ATCC 23134 TaxID=313606 RepID=A1ZJ48_MICM2|nr:hypothetical protein [Microscilla marina]EAY29584.1 hypothetical protein M23134_00468 [Microscilla marina ATCC 23134]